MTWVPFADDSTPLTPPAGEVDTALTWQTDSANWRSDVTVTWPDGTSYTATRADGKRQTLAIEGVHATREQDRSYADWLVNTASTGARLPSAPYDLSTLTSEAVRATLCSINPASRVTFTSLPPQMPSTLTCICEGLEETISDTDWTINFKLSPDVYSRFDIWDVSTYDSGALWAP